jgi:hypothetical protein
MWQSIGNAARVTVALFIRQHLWKVLFIVNLVLTFFAVQAAFGSTKLF